MNAIVYRNTKTTLPGWVPTLHESQPRGIAYETHSHFVHFYGVDNNLWTISTGLTATEQKNSSLTEWVERVFGAEDIQPSRNQVGYTVQGVWRPGLYFQPEVWQGLGTSESEQRSAEQALRLLVERLDELLLYIEPNSHGLQTYSHKTRELLILACTEVENSWKYYMRISGATPGSRDFTTKDYVKLSSHLYLPEFQVTLKPYSIPQIRPFDGWNSSAPTRSLPWYDAYNKTKHDRDTYFDEATLERCFQSVAANIVMFCVRFSPFPLLSASNTLSSLINQLFAIELCNCTPELFYIPKIELPSDVPNDLMCGNTQKFVKYWQVQPLRV